MLKPIKILLVVLCLVSIHTNIDLVYQGHLICTCYLLGLFGLLLLYWNRQLVTVADLLQISAIPIIGLVSIIISPEGDLHWAHGMRALAQLAYSIILAYSVYVELSRWPAQLIGKVFGWILAILTIGTVAEVHVPLIRWLDEIYRARVYIIDANIGQGLYVTDDEQSTRDLELAGHTRPTLFTQEPSFVALSLLLCLAVWIKATTMPAAVPLYLVALALGVYSIRSPILLAALPALVIACKSGWTRWLWLGAGLLAVLCLSSLFSSRGGSTDMSTASRITLPYMLAGHVIMEYPLGGVGLGQAETCNDDIRCMAASIGLDFFWVPGNIPIHTIALCNTFCLMIVFFGVGLGALVIYNLIRLIVIYGNGQIFYILILTFALWNGQGSFVGPRVWTYFWILLATMRSLATAEVNYSEGEAIVLTVHAAAESPTTASA